MRTGLSHLAALAGVFLGASGLAHATTLTVEAPATRGGDTWRTSVDAAARQFALNAGVLTRASRRHQGISLPLALPMRVVLTQNGRPLAPVSRGRDGTFALEFDPARPFPTEYRALLESVWARAQSRILGLIGTPSQSGPVRISLYDEDLPDRDAVAGGVFVVNAPGGPEIRFPVYNSPETAAVNFVHTILLATRGTHALSGDGWNEGLTRALTMAVCRTPGALPDTLDAAGVEGVLDATYDIGATYDVNNQRALGGPSFIASNLRSLPLPAGGSTGGLYLLRYQMAGTAWQKVLTEYPTFAAEFLARFDQNTAAYGNDQALTNLAQTSINAIEGPLATLEGQTFADWAQRQFILDTDLTPGNKVLVQAFPFLSGLSGTDFGVFGIEAHFFRSDPFGNEELLRETAYPIYWSPDFTRVFLAAQDDVLPIFAGYGSVTPNFTDAFGGQPYRMTVDVPIEDRIARLFLPAGAVATATNPTPNRLYGTVSGISPTAGTTYLIRVEWGAGQTAEIPITNDAFGGLAETVDFGRTHRRIRVQVIREVAGGRDVLLERRVNKGPGDLGLNLAVDGDALRSLPGGLSGGLGTVGFVGAPWTTNLPQRLGIGDNDALIARWNPTLGRYDAYPNLGTLDAGQGSFVRSSVSVGVSYATLAPRAVSTAIALKPGWNLVVNSAPHDINFANLRVVVGTLSPYAWADAVTANLVAADAFAFTPSAPDVASGLPETGTLGATATWASGQVLYLRCFHSTGAVLVLDAPAPSAQRSQPFSVPAPSGGTPGVTTEAAISVGQGNHATEVRLGRAKRGTTALDRGLDAALPPSTGGLQARLRGANRLFREVRGPSKTESFILNLEGLRPGVPITCAVRQLAGKATRITIQPKGQLRRYALADQESFTMTPTTTNLELRITWAGGR